MRAIFFGFLLFCIWATGARWYYVCKIKGHCGQEVLDTRPKTLSLKYKDKIVLEGYEQFHFPENKIVPKMTANNEAFIEKLANHIRANPDQDLTIIGLVRENEKGITVGRHESLGTARAETIKNLLKAKGLDQSILDRISLDYKDVKGNDLLEPVIFELSENTTPSEYDKSTYSFFNMTYSDANFEFGSAEFKPGEPCRNHMDSVKTYLELYPEYALTIVGHTDSIDTDQFNDNLGLERAQSAKIYFTELGLASEKIKTETRGKRNPTATNSTEEGRQRNRRVKFILDKQ